MSNIWKFSSLSEPYIEKWIQKTITIENNNKWSEKFKHITKRYLDEHNVKKINEEFVSEVIIDEEMAGDDNAMDISISKEEAQTRIHDDNFCHLIDTEPLLRLDFMTETCLENPYLITDLAEHLSTNSIEKICNYLFTNNNNAKFIPLFITNFFPTFLKRDQSLIALDLLMKANIAYADDFKLVLMDLITNITIRGCILQELMQNSQKLHQIFISLLMETNITTDVFKHHLNTINMVYRDYKKTESLQNFIQNLLIENSSLCVNDTNYGRLLLTFLQAQKTFGLTNSVILGKLVEQHKSPFKKPCLSILNEIK